MNFNLGHLLFVIIFLLRLIPEWITLLLSYDITYAAKEPKAKNLIRIIVLSFSIFFNFAAYLLLHKLLWGHWNFIYTSKRIVGLLFTYQDMAYLPVSLLACVIFSFILGIALRFLLSYIFKHLYNRQPMTGTRKALLLLALVVISGAITGTFQASSDGFENIVINEIAGNNLSIATDSAGTVCDYIELYNTGAFDCALQQLYLSDDNNTLKKLAVPQTVIPAKEHLLIPLDGSTLSVKKEGKETFFLSDAFGNILDQVTTQTMYADFSFSRKPDGAQSWTLLSETPGISNAEGFSKLLSAPSFSHPGGFYDEAFYLSISADHNCKIYYTLDGSVPTASSNVYEQAIHIYDRSSEPNTYRSIQNVTGNWQDYVPDETPVDKAFVVRAVAIDENGAISDVITASYFVDLEEYSAKNVVSLVTDPEDLWGQNGIYVTGQAYDTWYLGSQEGRAPTANFLRRGRTYEVPASFEFYSPELSFSQGVGLRVTGGSSRYRPLKAFSLYARTDYSGSRVFDHNLFPEVSSHKLALRGGYANSICQEIFRDRNVATQRYVQVSVFINGEFWYNSNILEKYDAQYFQEYYGINPSNIVVYKGGALEEGIEEDVGLLQDIYDFLDSHDMSLDENYTAFGEIVDLQSYIDYICINVYINNVDFTETKNSVWWRSRNKTFNEYEDGKWRFCLYDLDATDWSGPSPGNKTKAENNSFIVSNKSTGNTPINSQRIFAALKENDCFAEQFVLTFMDLVNTNFQYDKIKAVMDAYGYNPTNYHHGNGGTNTLAHYEDFFENRPNYVAQHLATEFGLTGSVQPVTISTNDVQGGTVRLNTITPDLSCGEWTGEYFTDYAVTATAIAAPGYRFIGWEGSIRSAEPTVEIQLTEGGVELNAVFEKTGNP